MKILLWSFIFCALGGGGASPSADQQVLEQQKITCPSPAKLQYERWGESGRMAICKIEHGSFAAAENGKIVIVGENIHGKAAGEWRWFDSNGKLEKSELK